MADVKTRTSNFKFILPDFNQVTWHTDLYENWRAVDGLITRYFNIANYVGVWNNATSYSIGDRVLDTDLALIFEAQIAHVSAATGTFNDDRTANPTYWAAFTQEVQFRGAWAASTNYAAGDFVTYERPSGNTIFATAATSHLSSATFEEDEADSLWTVLLESIDVSDGDLVAIAALASTGVLVRTGTNTWSLRTITGTTNEIEVTDGDGVSGNPTIGLPDDVTITNDLTVGNDLGVTGNTTLTGTLGVTGKPSFNATSSARIPAGTTAQRDGSPAQGDVRFNTTNTQYEGYNGTSWGPLGGAGLYKGENGERGDTVNGAGDIFRINEQTLNTNTTIDADENASCAGPLTVASGVTLTVTSGGTLVIL